MHIDQEFDRFPDHHAASLEFVVEGDTLTVKEPSGGWDIVFARVS